MNGKDLLLGMSFISDELVEEAESQPIPGANPWKKWLPMAACLCLIVGAAGLFGALLPGMDNARQESSVLDNELAVDSQHSLTGSGQENGGAVVWNFAVSGEILFPNAGTVNETYGDALPGGNEYPRLYTEKTDSSLLPTENMTVGLFRYLPESWESTWISGTEVQFFLVDNGTLLARFVVPYNETEYLLVTAVSDSLSEEHFLTAVTKILEDPEVLP